ncbi:hypothetical protein P43SY_011587 [Pythium insidiosum]|uniref:ribonuclease Z n=1 Tax=Pythium insidiosum TaxID=114742 RepID=A0AAD5L7N7_PYTIN|nr:hypothetical protein P43SY_011587 [Pythium insidiosum]
MAGFVSQVAKAEAEAEAITEAEASPSESPSACVSSAQRRRSAVLPPRLNGCVTFLGTGCAIPSKYRNVTGIHLEFPADSDADADADLDSDAETHGDDSAAAVESSRAAWSGMMLDCGEGSLGQLYRCTNGDEQCLRALVRRLKCVWISHNHADHHLGLLRLLSYRHTG